MDKAHSVSPVTTTPRVGASDARPLLELRGLTAGYGDLSAVRGLSLVLHPGEIVALDQLHKRARSGLCFVPAGPRMTCTGTHREQFPHWISQEALEF